jgi:hypothetical protein
MNLTAITEPDQVAEGPGYGVAVSLDKTVFTVRGSHDGGDLTRHRGLFCDNYLHDDSDFSVVVFL